MAAAAAQTWGRERAPWSNRQIKHPTHVLTDAPTARCASDTCASVCSNEEDQGFNSHATPNGASRSSLVRFCFFFSFLFSFLSESSLNLHSFPLDLKIPQSQAANSIKQLARKDDSAAGRGTTWPIDRLCCVDRLLTSSKRFKYGCGPADEAIHQAASDILQEGLGQGMADGSKETKTLRLTPHFSGKQMCFLFAAVNLQNDVFTLCQSAHYYPIVSLHETSSGLHLAFSRGCCPAVSGQVKQDISGLLAEATALKP